MIGMPPNPFARREDEDVPSWWARLKAVKKTTLSGWEPVLFDIAWEEARKQTAQQNQDKRPRPNGQCRKSTQ